MRMADKASCEQNGEEVDIEEQEQAATENCAIHRKRVDVQWGPWEFGNLIDTSSQEFTRDFIQILIINW